MVRDIETAKRLCYVTEDEERLMKTSIRPVVLLRKRPDCPVAESVARYQKYHGIMLPYTPLHHLIVEESELVLVMTSGRALPWIYFFSLCARSIASFAVAICILVAAAP